MWQPDLCESLEPENESNVDLIQVSNDSESNTKQTSFIVKVAKLIG